MDTNLIGNEAKQEEPNKKAKQEKIKSETPKPKKAEPLIYVGPNLQGGRLLRFTVFKEGIPAHLDDLLEKQPAIKRLIVPVNRFSEELARVAKPGTIEHQAFHDILKEGKGD